MFKAILVACLIASSLGALVISSTTLASPSGASMTLETKANSSNSSNTDIVWTISKTAAITDNNMFAWYCVDTAASDFSVVDGRTNYTTFGFEALAAAADFGTAVDGIEYNTGTTTYAATGTTYTTSAWSAVTTPAATAASVNTTVGTVTWSGVTDTQLTTMRMPVSSAVYCKTFYAIDIADAATTAVDLNAVLTAGSNLKLNSATVTVGAILAASAAAAFF